MPLGCPLKRLEFTCEDLEVKAASRKYECNHCHQKKLGRAIPTLYNHYIKCPKVKDDKKNKYDSNGQLIGKEKGYSIDTENIEIENDNITFLKTAILQELKIEDWGMEDLELDACCLDEMKFNFRIMDELADLNLESVDEI